MTNCFSVLIGQRTDSTWQKPERAGPPSIGPKLLPKLAQKNSVSKKLCLNIFKN